MDRGRKTLRRAALQKVDIAGFCCRLHAHSCSSIGCFALMRMNALLAICMASQEGRMLAIATAYAFGFSMHIWPPTIAHPITPTANCWAFVDFSARNKGTF